MVWKRASHSPYSLTQTYAQDPLCRHLATTECLGPHSLQLGGAYKSTPGKSTRRRCPSTRGVSLAILTFQGIGYSVGLQPPGRVKLF